MRVVLDSLHGGRRIGLEAHVSVPSNSDDLYQHDLVVQWNEVEIDELYCGPESETIDELSVG